MRGRNVSVVLSLLASATLTTTHAATQAQLPNKQPATLSDARKALEGTWRLISLTVYTADGRSAGVEATGTLTASFSDMSIEFDMSPKGLAALAGIGVKSPNPVIKTSGRVLIDTQQQQIAYVGDDFHAKALGFDPDLAARRANPFALERIRKYSFNDDGTLRLATQHDNGKDASVSVWKKAAS